MISIDKYSLEEINQLYSAVERAVVGDDLLDIANIIKPGDFFLVGKTANGLVFTFDGLIWEKDGIEYDALLQPQYSSDKLFPRWKVVITRAKTGKLKGSSSGATDMILKSYRKEVTCKDCARFNNDMACYACDEDDSAVRDGKLCSGFIEK